MTAIILMDAERKFAELAVEAAKTLNEVIARLKHDVHGYGIIGDRRELQELINRTARTRACARIVEEVLTAHADQSQVVSSVNLSVVSTDREAIKMMSVSEELSHSSVLLARSLLRRNPVANTATMNCRGKSDDHYVYKVIHKEGVTTFDARAELAKNQRVLEAIDRSMLLEIAAKTLVGLGVPDKEGRLASMMPSDIYEMILLLDPDAIPATCRASHHNQEPETYPAIASASIGAP